ncbi:MAG: hypothetical protein R2879_20755 [Saprospiraceae bacterium]
MAWNLKSIELPSGGKINVEYEADDYAYIQDRRAGQMFFISGFANDTSSYVTTPLTTLYNGAEPSRYIIVDLPKR